MNKIEKPKKIAICLNTSDPIRALEQKNTLFEVESFFEVEWDLRSDRFLGEYISFSQMINESIICTKSEFMIFINPKSQVKPLDIYNIVEDLCNGYGLSCLISFGLWGTTKQLFRKIGMMDERFIGGEWEDNDMMLRIKQGNIAVSYQFDTSRYIDRNSRSGNGLRALSSSAFKDKWITKENKCWQSIFSTKEKQLPSYMLADNNVNIEKSWMEWKESKAINAPKWSVYHFANYFNIQDNKIDYTYEIIDCSIKIETDTDGNIILLFHCNQNSTLSIVITEQIDFKESIPENFENLIRINIENNTKIRYPWKPNPQKKYSINIAHGGRMIYSNDYCSIPTPQLQFGLKSKKYKTTEDEK